MGMRRMVKQQPPGATLPRSQAAYTRAQHCKARVFKMPQPPLSPTPPYTRVARVTPLRIPAWRASPPSLYPRGARHPPPYTRVARVTPLRIPAWRASPPSLYPHGARHPPRYALAMPCAAFCMPLDGARCLVMPRCLAMPLSVHKLPHSPALFWRAPALSLP
jgi:hypothetical protein